MCTVIISQIITFAVVFVALVPQIQAHLLERHNTGVRERQVAISGHILSQSPGNSQ